MIRTIDPHTEEAAWDLTRKPADEEIDQRTLGAALVVIAAPPVVEDE